MLDDCDDRTRTVDSDGRHDDGWVLDPSAGRALAHTAAVDDTDLDELAEVLVTASRALMGIAVRSIEAATVAVTVPQHRVLVLLAAEGPQAVGQLAEQLGVNPSNATRVCDRLQRLDLVERTPSSEDGRGVQVSITAAGVRLVRAVAAQRRTEVAAILRDLPAGEARAAVLALASFNRAAHERSEPEWSSAI